MRRAEVPNCLDKLRSHVRVDERHGVAEELHQRGLRVGSVSSHEREAIFVVGVTVNDSQSIALSRQTHGFLGLRDDVVRVDEVTESFRSFIRVVMPTPRRSSSHLGVDARLAILVVWSVR